MKLSIDAQDALMVSLRDLIDSGDERPRLVICTGKGKNEHVLSEHYLARPCGVVRDGSLVFGPLSEDDSARIAGVPVCGKIYNGDRKLVIEVEAGKELRLTSEMKRIEQGQTVGVPSLTIRA